MTVSPDIPPGTVPALTAFLRGVERRGALFAELLAGSVEAGDPALQSAMGTFGEVAGRAPFADWPRRFWALLLASPALRTAHPDALWTPPFEALGDVGLGPRAALLLRLVAGLGEADAAAVLGVARPTYRLAVQRALPRLPDGSPDTTTWEALAEAARDALKALPPERLAQVAVVREQVLHGTEPLAGDGGPFDAGRPRWLALALAAVAVVTAAALLATLWWPAASRRNGAGDRIRIEPLAAAPPASRFGSAAALPTHPDLELLLDPPEPAAADPGFFAWLAAQDGADGGARGDTAAPALPAAGEPAAPAPDTDSPGLESRDAPR
ncbi:MAG TPA: hypothetical protein VLK29_01785 [Luteimonas sp.]|nr:hypothetical protein [Luteimonas sp.]